MSISHYDNHSQTATERLCAEVYPDLLRVLTAMVGNRETAEDLTQEAMLRAWLHATRVIGMDHPRGWLFKVGVNLGRSHLRRARLEARVLPLFGRDATTNQADGSLAVEARGSLMQLPPRQRAAVALRYLTDLSVAETAVVLRCAEGTVKALTHQAVSTLRTNAAVDDRVSGGATHER